MGHFEGVSCPSCGRRGSNLQLEIQAVTSYACFVAAFDDSGRLASTSSVRLIWCVKPGHELTSTGVARCVMCQHIDTLANFGIRQTDGIAVDQDAIQEILCTS